MIKEKERYTKEELKLLKKNPEWVGVRRKIKQMIQEDVETKVYL